MARREELKGNGRGRAAAVQADRNILDSSTAKIQNSKFEYSGG